MGGAKIPMPVYRAFKEIRKKLGLKSMGGCKSPHALFIK
jgi:hypothetical protein